MAELQARFMESIRGRNPNSSFIFWTASSKTRTGGSGTRRSQHKNMTLTESPAQIIPPAASHSQFPGFDTGNYPGDPLMLAWANGKSPYRFCAYYLDAPCHGTHAFPARWMGHRQALNAAGWGFIIVYVGLQASGCGFASLSRARGVADALDAIDKTTTEEFPAGAIIFLDVEAIQVSPTPPAYLAYFTGWLDTILESAFSPGVYCNKPDGMKLAAIASTQAVMLGKPEVDTKFWIVELLSRFSLTSSPKDCGTSLANIWQGKFDVRGEMHNGHSMPVLDQNVASEADPSHGRIDLIT